MKNWIKGAIIGGLGGIILHITNVFLGPLIIGKLLNSQQILDLSCYNCILDITRFLVFLIIGMIVGIIIGAFFNKRVK